MRILLSTMNVIEFDGSHHCNNALSDIIPRYKIFGDDITLLCHKKDSENPKSKRLNLDTVRFIPIKKSFIVCPQETKDLIENKVRGTDLCIVHLPSFHGEQVIKAAIKFQKPYLTVICGCPWDSLWNYNWKGKLLAPLMYMRLRKVQRNASYSIYVTKSFLQRRYPTSGKWINCSNVEVSAGAPDVLDKRLDNIDKRQAEGRIIRIGTAAAIDVPYKGQEYVIRAIAKLKEEGINMHYYMIGTGCKDRLQQIVNQLNVNDSVFFMGALSHDKVAEFYDDLDIYIQPSKQEGLPRSTIEAMSRGCLCLGTNIAGIPELLPKEYLFPKGNANKIAILLKGIKKEDYAIQARRNFEAAKDYDREVLNARRKHFLLEFKNAYKS